MGQFELSNPKVHLSDGTTIKKEEIGIRWERVLENEHLTLHDVLTFRHYGHQAAELSLDVTFQAEFEDIFAVKGMLPEHLGRQYPPTWKDGVLHFLYQGHDRLYRSVSVDFSHPVESTTGTTAHMRITLNPQETKQIRLSLVIRESPHLEGVQHQTPRVEPDLRALAFRLHHDAQTWVHSLAEFTSDSFVLQQIINRSLRDLRVLRSTLNGQTFFAAGVPWFATLFGRDSLITALQMLAYDPDICAHTLRLLASYQGTQIDEWRDEQPGKILHELRVGQAARLGLIPQTPYYGSIDATLLFLILIGDHASWTGDLGLFHELRSHVDRALEWMDVYGDRHGEDYVAYTSSSDSSHRLVNQGWKDSGDAIVNADGSIATPPIALVEVQGYAYRAKLAMAALYERAEDPDRAHRLRHEAQRLKQRFNRDFWMDDRAFYMLARQSQGKPVTVVSSNPGHALWSGIVDQDKAKPTVDRLMAKEMFTGWGIRTLSDQEHAFNPISYHLGSVWPHDNALIAAGCRRYGYDEAAHRVFNGLLQAAIHFKAYQLPELFCGFHEEDDPIPVPYPVAVHPQAWASGAMPYLLTTLLGLSPEAFSHRLRIVRPMLPESVHVLEVHRLRVGQASVHLLFEAGPQSTVQVHVLKIDGDLKVVIEPDNRRSRGLYSNG
jgi:glycogen debranching enzyme